MMKKYFALLLLSVSLFFFSCKKESLHLKNEVANAPQKGLVQSNQRLDFYNEGRFLVFPSRKSYENVVNEPSQEKINEVYRRLDSLEHNSWYNAEERAENTIDGYFEYILSVDRTIQIGPYIIKINPEDELVMVLHYSHINQYMDLVHNNYDAANMMVYSTQSEVLDELEKNLTDNIEDLDPIEEGWFRDGVNIFIGILLGGGDKLEEVLCEETHAGGNGDHESTEEIIDRNGKPIAATAEIAYFKLGVYFTFYTKGSRPTSDDTNFKMVLFIRDYWFKKRCRSPRGPYDRDYGYIVSKEGFYNLYRGVRALNGYHGKVKIELLQKIGVDNYGDDVFRIEFSDYATIDKNSPFTN